MKLFWTRKIGLEAINERNKHYYTDSSTQRRLCFVSKGSR